MEQPIKEYLYWHPLTKLFREQVQREMQLESMAGGDRLLSQGEDPQTLYLLVKGKLKISMLFPEGKITILDRTSLIAQAD